jgi:membrane-associated phospholipid phosphatase
MGRASRLLVPTAAVAVLVASARRCSDSEVRPLEERVFRFFNDGPEQLHIPVWAVMQSGSLAGVYVVAGELLRRGRRPEAGAVAVAGTAVWGGVKVVKPYVGRGRPSRHLDDVAVRGEAQTGLGFPSGHAAVALTVGLIAANRSRGWVKALAVVSAGVTGAARMYVGAHLPLDVAGGLAIGLLSGGAARTMLGARETA